MATHPYGSPLESFTSLFSSSRPNLTTSTASLASSSSSTSSSSVLDWIPQDPIAVGILSALGGTVLTLGSIAGYRRYWRRIRNANSVTSGMLDRKTWIRGVVTSVGDGDNLRLFHTPGPFYRWPLKIRSIPSTPKELKDETLNIRIAGVDAPENAHFGQPAQPHAKESLEWLRATILGKRMRCQLLAKDQYQRIVAVPYISRTLWFDKPLPLLMLQKGMAVVYEAGGAEYGPWGIEKMKAIEAEARAAKRGLWSLKKFEHPGAFKARMKRPDEVRVPIKNQSSGSGLWRMIKRLIGSRQ
nr:uncharacterized protein CI109_000078 [Kwoniella shandongensis]KAA5531238.1 hypothetical protein CI109_000078 [Kwoniella shandongensis]